MKLRFTFLLLLAVLSTDLSKAGTYQDVVAIFGASCAFSSCHDATNPSAGLDLTASESDIYAQLINGTPFNPEAANKGYKLVKPGDPGRSFLYRKMNHGLHSDSNLEAGMGGNMPPSSAIPKKDIELVRQWILFGAKGGNSNDVNQSVIEDYYAQDPAPFVAPPPPAEGEGFQLHLGPLFLEPGEEIEYIYRYELQNENPLDVNKIDVQMNQESHHFLFFQFKEGEENAQPDGLIEVDLLGLITGNGSAITSDTKMIGGWAYSKEFELPSGTALRWNDNAVLKFNYHIANYSQTAILPAEVYINVYTDEYGTAPLEMHSEFQITTSTLLLPEGESTLDWDFDGFDQASSSDSVHIWSLAAHTHKYGTDFDIYRGDNGEQIYEGFYNLDYSANQGYYDYSEPAYRFYEPFESMRAGDGIFVEADYDVTQPGGVSMGLTTEDEMFGFFLQYIVGDNVAATLAEFNEPGVNSVSISKANRMEAYPNPSNGKLNLHIPNNSGTLQVSLFNILGEEVKQISLTGGQTDYPIDISDLSSGCYLLHLRAEEFSETRKVTLQRD